MIHRLTCVDVHEGDDAGPDDNEVQYGGAVHVVLSKNTTKQATGYAMRHNATNDRHALRAARRSSGSGQIVYDRLPTA